MEKMTVERQFRIQAGWTRERGYFPPLTIPWKMIEPHEPQALKNHCGQDLETLDRRMGLSPDEALAVLDDREWKEMDAAEAYDELVRRKEEYENN